MIKRLGALSGLAIIAVVCNHAAGYGQIAMFLWAHRYRPVTSPNWDLIGSLPYYISLAIRQVGDISVPAFLFISGFFVAYASRGSMDKLDWKIIRMRIQNLIVPYLLWSLVMFSMLFIQGTRYSLIEYLGLLFFRGADPGYYFIPLLCYLYILSPLLVTFAKAQWKVVLLVSALLQLSTASLRYLELFQFNTKLLTYLLSITPNWSLTRWIFFFVLGVVSGLRVESFRQFIHQHRTIFYIATPLLYLMVIAESDLLLRHTLKYWGAHIGSFSLIFFVTSFILCFFALRKVPLERILSRLGSKTYGIYLIHIIVIAIVAKFFYKFMPWMLAYQTLFQPILFTLGLGIPLLFMIIVNKSPMRSLYRYVFG